MDQPQRKLYAPFIKKEFVSSSSPSSLFSTNKFSLIKLGEKNEFDGAAKFTKHILKAINDEQEQSSLSHQQLQAKKDELFPQSSISQTVQSLKIDKEKKEVNLSFYMNEIHVVSEQIKLDLKYISGELDMFKEKLYKVEKSLMLFDIQYPSTNSFQADTSPARLV